MEGSDPEYVECIVTEGDVIVYTGAALTIVIVTTIMLIMKMTMTVNDTIIHELSTR